MFEIFLKLFFNPVDQEAAKRTTTGLAARGRTFDFCTNSYWPGARTST